MQNFNQPTKTNPNFSLWETHKKSLSMLVKLKSQTPGGIFAILTYPKDPEIKG